MHKISPFQYITQDLPGTSHSELVLKACDAGAGWIQLRVKNKPFNAWLKIAEQASIICKRYNAKLIINDNVEICRLLEAEGVHLGKKDMSIAMAKSILGNRIVGGTANNLDDIKKLIDDKVDYIGLGPFRYTSTKENLSPILGLEGIAGILKNLITDVPIIAVGGITLEDIGPLLNNGVQGIAVSSAINKSADMHTEIKNFQKKIKTYYHEQVNYCR